MHRKCSNCYYYQNCEGASPCKFYDPIEEEIDDTTIQRIVQKNRNIYEKAWRSYIKCFEN